MDSSVINKIGLAATLDLPDGADVSERDRVYIQATAQAAQGMSLRDYFAAKALQGLLASPQITGNGGLDNWPDQSFAQFSYRLADAMLAARLA